MGSSRSYSGSGIFILLTLIVAVHGFIAGLASIVMLLFVCYLMMHIDFKQLTLL